VGTGIRTGLQTTTEARSAIRHADIVLYLTTDPLADAWVRRLNPIARSLTKHYTIGRPRRQAYDLMVQEILAELRRGLDVCAVFYGHPGVFVSPSHEAIAAAREMGYPAVMFPAVSAEDCLVADLGIDPGAEGWQSYEATDFLMHRRAIDTATPLVLWQVSMIGAWHTVSRPNVEGLAILAERLGQLYGPRHEVVLYEAAEYPIGDPLIVRLPVEELAEAGVTPMATLYVPPARRPERDQEMIARLKRSSEVEPVADS
jgi:Tetrapyrrole (Corrin/Porphyrin) Methylases